MGIWIAMMLGKKYLLDRKFGKAMDRFLDCVQSEEGDALVMAFYCALMKGNRSEEKILDLFRAAHPPAITGEIPVSFDETFEEKIDSLCEQWKDEFSFIIEGQKITLKKRIKR